MESTEQQRARLFSKCDEALLNMAMQSGASAAPANNNDGWSSRSTPEANAGREEPSHLRSKLSMTEKELNATRVSLKIVNDLTERLRKERNEARNYLRDQELEMERARKQHQEEFYKRSFNTEKELNRLRHELELKEKQLNETIKTNQAFVKDLRKKFEDLTEEDKQEKIQLREELEVTNGRLQMALKTNEQLVQQQKTKEEQLDEMVAKIVSLEGQLSSVKVEAEDTRQAKLTLEQQLEAKDLMVKKLSSTLKMVREELKGKVEELVDSRRDWYLQLETLKRQYLNNLRLSNERMTGMMAEEMALLMDGLEEQGNNNATSQRSTGSEQLSDGGKGQVNDGPVPGQSDKGSAPVQGGNPTRKGYNLREPSARVRTARYFPNADDDDSDMHEDGLDDGGEDKGDDGDNDDWEEHQDMDCANANTSQSSPQALHACHQCSSDGVQSKCRRGCLTCLCGKGYSEPAYLRKHLKYFNVERKRVECGRCGKPFNKKSNLTRHLKRKNPCEPKLAENDGSGSPSLKRQRMLEGKEEEQEGDAEIEMPALMNDNVDDDNAFLPILFPVSPTYDPVGDSSSGEIVLME